MFLSTRVRKLEDAYLLQGQTLTGHIAACEKRGARQERLLWAVGTVVVATLGLLLRAYFKIGM